LGFDDILCGGIVCSAVNLGFSAEVELSAANFKFTAELCVLQQI